MNTLKLILTISAILILSISCGGGSGDTPPISDSTAPKVESFYPDPATDGDVSSADIQTNGIKVLFDEGMNPATIDSNSFSVEISPGFGGGSITGTVTYDPAVRTAKFVPDNALNASWDYLVTVSAEVTDTSGNNIAADFTQIITIGAAAPPGGAP